MQYFDEGNHRTAHTKIYVKRNPSISHSLGKTKLSSSKSFRSASGKFQCVLRRSYKFSIGIKEKGTHLVAKSHFTVNSNPYF